MERYLPCLLPKTGIFHAQRCEEDWVLNMSKILRTDCRNSDLVRQCLRSPNLIGAILAIGTIRMMIWKPV